MVRLRSNCSGDPGAAVPRAGVGTFADAFPALRSPELRSWGVWDLAHSTILEIAFEMGIPMATLVVIGALASFLILVRAAVTSVGRERRLMAAIAGIAALSYLHSLIDFSLQIPGYLILFGVLLGCGLANASSDPRKRRSSVEGSTRSDVNVGEESATARYSSPAPSGAMHRRTNSSGGDYRVATRNLLFICDMFRAVSGGLIAFQKRGSVSD